MIKTEYIYPKIKDFEDIQPSGESYTLRYKGQKVIVQPEFQREFVYKPAEQASVIESIMNKYPLGMFYWGQVNQDDIVVVDGQQRLTSILNFINGLCTDEDGESFDDYSSHFKDIFFNYEIPVAFVTTEEQDDLYKWFERTNVPGKRLTMQEIYDAVGTGQLVNQMSKQMKDIENDPRVIEFIGKTDSRKALSETCYNWNGYYKESIKKFIQERRNDPNAAKTLYDKFILILEWVDKKFSQYKGTKGLNKVSWEIIFNHRDKLDHDLVKILLSDNPSGASIDSILKYVVGENKSFEERAFPQYMINQLPDEKRNTCAYDGDGKCSGKLQADHIVPWSKGGKTTVDNLQMLCQWHNSHKSDN